MTTPIWQQIRNTLEREISDGTFSAGDKLPTETELSRRFGVNRHTVRRALAEMQGDGLVHARRGAGVFVTARPMIYRVGRHTRFSQNLKDAGRSGDRQIIRLETLPATKADAKHLEIRRGEPVHTLEAIGMIDGVPTFLNHSIFPAAMLGGFIDTMRETRSITSALAASGIRDYRRDWTRLSAERATGIVARHLQVQEGAPLMVTRSLNRTSDGTAVEYARTTLCADRIELLIEAEN